MDHSFDSLTPLQSGMPIDWLVRALAKEGVELPLIARRLNVKEAQLVEESVILSSGEFNQFFDWAAEHLKNLNLGLDLSQKIDALEFGLLGYLTSNTSSICDW